MLRAVPLLTLLAAAGTARAQELPGAAPAPQRVQLLYEAEPSCVDQAAVALEIAGKVERSIAWVGGDGAPERVVRLRVHATAEQRFVGRVEVAEPPAPPTARDFEAETCQEVVSSLALIVALTLDGQPPSEPPATTAPPAATKPPAVAASSLEPDPIPPEYRVEAPRPPRVTFYVGVNVGTSFSWAPVPVVMLGGLLGARFHRMHELEPALQLTVLSGKTAVIGPAVADAEFSMVMARLEACPKQFPLAASGFDVLPCAVGELGSLDVRGSASIAAEPIDAERWWGATGVSLAGRFRHDGWFAALAGSAMIALTRDEFVLLQPRQSIHRASLLAFALNLALGTTL